MQIGDKVKIKRSGEPGEIVGASQHKNTKDQVLVQYVGGDGRASEGWFFQDEIELAKS